MSLEQLQEDIMPIVVAVLLACTAVVTTVTSRIAFRLACSDGATRGGAWGVAGGTAVATVVDVCTVASALDVPGTPSEVRIGGTTVWVLLAIAGAYLAYDVTGPTTTPLSGMVTGGLSRAKRWAAAGGTFTGTLLILNAVLPLLT